MYEWMKEWVLELSETDEAPDRVKRFSTKQPFSQLWLDV